MINGSNAINVNNDLRSNLLRKSIYLINQDKSSIINHIIHTNHIRNIIKCQEEEER